MKTKLTIAAFAFIAATFLAAPATAQVASAKHTAQIPFAFKLGATELPAGDYSITLIGNRMQLRSLATGKATDVAAIPTTGRRNVEVSHLKFDRQGDTMVLTNVYFAGGTEGLELLANKVRAASRM